MSSKDELIRAMTISLSIAIDMRDEDIEKISGCDCPICQTFCNAMTVYETLKAAAGIMEVKGCLH